MRRPSWLTLLVVLATLPASATALGAADQPDHVLAINCHVLQYEPAQITLTCATGGTYLSGLDWSSWGRHRAIAAGTYNVVQCGRACVGGQVSSYRVRITLGKPRTCRTSDKRAFRLVKFSFRGSQPQGAPSSTTLPCP